jgi:hypothetical protein
LIVYEPNESECYITLGWKSLVNVLFMYFFFFFVAYPLYLVFYLV